MALPKDITPTGEPDRSPNGRSEIWSIIDPGQATDVELLYLAKHGAGDQENPHTHDDQAGLYFIEEGEAIFHIDGNEYPCKAGSVAYVPPGVLHWRKQTSEELRFWFVGLFGSTE